MQKIDYLERNTIGGFFFNYYKSLAYMVSNKGIDIKIDKSTDRFDVLYSRNGKIIDQSRVMIKPNGFIENKESRGEISNLLFNESLKATRIYIKELSLEGKIIDCI